MHITHFKHMKIFFGCTAARLAEYQDNYLQIREELITQGHVLTRDWLPEAVKRLDQHKSLQRYEPKKMFSAVKRSIMEAEAVVIEDTVSNFSTGYEITFALQQNKPVLVLWLKEKYHPFEHTFLHGVDADNLEIAMYNKESLPKQLRGFLKKYENAGERHRFNLVLTDTERAYLDWAHYKRGTSRTQLIRNSLRGTIESDTEYTSYLQGDSTDAH